MSNAMDYGDQQEQARPDYTAKPATREGEEEPLAIGVIGPPGGGKTLSSLLLAKGMQSVRGGPIIVLDTEGGRSRKYSTQIKFEIVELKPPFRSSMLRDAIKAQGGILDAASAESRGAGDAVSSAVAGWDTAVEQHRVALGVLDVAGEAGELGAFGPQWVKARRAEIAAVERAGARLKKMDVVSALAGDDAKQVHRALEALDEYGTAVAALDDSMRPSHGDIVGMRPRVKLGKLEDMPAVPGEGPGGQLNRGIDEAQAARMRAEGAAHELSVQGDMGMIADEIPGDPRIGRPARPGAQAEYKALHGEDWRASSEPMFRGREVVAEGGAMVQGIDDLAPGVHGAVGSEAGTVAKVRRVAKGTPQGDALADAL